MSKNFKIRFEQNYLTRENIVSTYTARYLVKTKKKKILKCNIGYHFGMTVCYSGYGVAQKSMTSARAI